MGNFNKKGKDKGQKNVGKNEWQKQQTYCSFTKTSHFIQLHVKISVCQRLLQTIAIKWKVFMRTKVKVTRKAER